MSVQQRLLDVSVHQMHVHVTVDELLCVIFALLTAASNAVAAVLQRKAAAQVPLERSMHVSLIADLMHRRVWLAGIAMVIVAAVAQATALAFGPIALVQPIFIIELPLTLLLSTLLFRGRDSLHQLLVRAIIITTVALGGALAAAQPSGARRFRAGYELDDRADRHGRLRGRPDQHGGWPARRAAGGAARLAAACGYR